MLDAPNVPPQSRVAPPQTTRPRGPVEPLSSLHVFEFRGASFAYFVRTGDLVGLSPEAASVLRWHEQAIDRRTIEERAVAELGDQAAAEVLSDLDSLEQAGLLAPDVSLTRRERHSDLERLLRHQPRNLMFFVTEACNLKCTYCYENIQGVHASARMLKQVDAERTIDNYFAGSPRRQALTITFFGGEPLLNPKVIRETVAYAKKKGLQTGQEVGFTMTSNLTLLTEDMAEFLASEKFHVMVSIDGDEESHDRYRKAVDGSGTYELTTRNLTMLIEKMRAHGTRLPKIRATLTAENADPIAAERHLRTLGTPLVMIGETHGTVEGSAAHDVDADERTLDASTQAVEDVVDRVLRQLAAEPDVIPELPRAIVEGLSAIHEEVSRKEPHGPARPSLCGVCRNMKAVTPEGDLYPCHRYVGMKAFKMGNTHEGGLDKEKVRNYYDQIYGSYEEKCAPCWLRHLCGGQCAWYLSTEDGTVATPDDNTCDQIRAGYERRMGLYATLLDRFPVAFGEILGAAAAELRGADAGILATDCKDKKSDDFDADRD